ncbi:MAG TPA: DUF2085 domain-containing protein [Bacteroidota bacterium]
MNLSRRIYAVLLISTGLWCLAIVLTPILRVVGGEAGATMANACYRGFSRICHQLDERSLHLLGAKFGVCIRCTAIYFSFFFGVIVYPFVRSLRTKETPDMRWLFAAIAPMVLDALFNDLGIFRSGELSRVITGSVGGFVLAFFIVPLFIDAITQILIHRTSQGETHYAGQTQ